MAVCDVIAIEQSTKNVVKIRHESLIHSPSAIALFKFSNIGLNSDLSVCSLLMSILLAKNSDGSGGFALHDLSSGRSSYPSKQVHE